MSTAYPTPGPGPEPTPSTAESTPGTGAGAVPGHRSGGDTSGHVPGPRGVHAGPLLLGIVAIGVALASATLEVTHMTKLLSGPTPVQWLFGLGALCVVLGLIGLLARRHRS